MGIEERRRVSGEREENFVEHGNGGVGAVGAWFLRVRTVRRWTKTMSRLNSSNRHMKNASRCGHCMRELLVGYG